MCEWEGTVNSMTTQCAPPPKIYYFQIWLLYSGTLAVMYISCTYRFKTFFCHDFTLFSRKQVSIWNERRRKGKVLSLFLSFSLVLECYIKNFFSSLLPCLAFFPEKNKKEKEFQRAPFPLYYIPQRCPIKWWRKQLVQEKKVCSYNTHYVSYIRWWCSVVVVSWEKDELVFIVVW